jgi:glycosyltransferase involved in cell wall biosynthesis
MVLIPAYNERPSVADVIARVPVMAGGVQTVVVVVDDGSGDGTATAAAAAGGVVVRHPRRRGGGAALRTGYRLAAAAEASVVVTLDADGQHQPEEMERLVAPVLEGRAGLACGSRVLGTTEREGHARAVGIRLFSRMLSILLRRPVTDCSNSFRAMRGDLPGALDLRENQFHAAELLVEAVTRGTTVIEVPVTVRARAHGTTGKPPTLRYGAGFTKAIAAAWLRSVRRRSRRTDRTPLAVERAAPERPHG